PLVENRPHEPFPHRQVDDVPRQSRCLILVPGLVCRARQKNLDDHRPTVATRLLRFGEQGTKERRPLIRVAERKHRPAKHDLLLLALSEGWRLAMLPNVILHPLPDGRYLAMSKRDPGL